MLPIGKFFSARNNKKKRYNYESANKLAMTLIIPSMLVMGFVIIYPLLRAFYLSFFNYKLTRPDQFSFSLTDNYARIINDQVFWIAFKNTIVFTFFTVAIGLLLGLIMAIALDQLSQRLEGLRGLVLVPWVIPGIVVGYLFMYIFDVEVGILNYTLQQLGIIQDYLPWLMRDQLAMIAIIVAHVWNQAPFYMLMFAVSLKAIPEDVKEAAYVEGASRWQEFFHVTFPYLKGTFVIASLLMVIRNFNNFPIIFTMTGGGPVYSTTTSVIYIYRKAFEQFDLGYASAIGIVWVVILLLISVIYVRSLQKDF
ncbi:MAG: ABC transporter permease [Desulfitibacter sp. BRH_c19]|nr:MAG: ABC transporter permease [Desulfitibacter sp. BRH_c19]